jgi:acetyl-CoA acetyltransferase
MSPLPDVFDVFIVGGARTPMTGFVGALKDVSALELGAIAAGTPAGIVDGGAAAVVEVIWQGRVVTSALRLESCK